jgi:hypothetical protein
LLSYEIDHGFWFIEDWGRQSHGEVIVSIYFLVAEACNGERHEAIKVKEGHIFFGVEGSEKAKEEGEDEIITDNGWQLE